MLNVNLLINKNSLYVKLDGEMDQHSSDTFRIKLNEIIVRNDIKNLIFNMENLDFMDSSLIGIIIGRYNQLRQNNGKIYICEVNDNIKRIISISGLNKICKILDTEYLVKKEIGEVL